MIANETTTGIHQSLNKVDVSTIGNNIAFNNEKNLYYRVGYKSPCHENIQ